MSPSTNDKLLAFEYVLFKLTKWFMLQRNIENYTDFNNANDLNKLKVIKLHFFVAAVNSNRNNLLDTFNKFYAMPYGHVESDIYNALNSLQNFKIDTKKLTINDTNGLSELCFATLNSQIKIEIDQSIETLKSINNQIINYNALDLVDLSHKWFSWTSMINYARQNNRNSELIPSSLIQQENKIFELVY